jgi:hypothetical protein
MATDATRVRLAQRLRDAALVLEAAEIWPPKAADARATRGDARLATLLRDAASELEALELGYVWRDRELLVLRRKLAAIERNASHAAELARRRRKWRIGL